MLKDTNDSLESVNIEITGPGIEGYPHCIPRPADMPLPLPGMGNPYHTGTRHFVVTLNSHEHLDNFYDEMELTSSLDHVPDRPVECADRRPLERSTGYLLTYEEAIKLSNDSRVHAVFLHPELRGDVKEVTGWSTTSTFSKSSWAPLDSNRANWGLWRTRNKTNNLNWGSTAPPTNIDNSFNETYKIGTSAELPLQTIFSNTSGKDVDVVIVDATDFGNGYIDPSTVEFQVNPDGTGGSRVIFYDWNKGLDSVNQRLLSRGELPIIGTPVDDPSFPHYKPEVYMRNQHNGHTTGTAVGNSQGFARDANIYNMSFRTSSCLSYIREFHKNKPINPITGVKNPTITNNSWAYNNYFNSAAGSSWIKEIHYRDMIYYPANMYADSTQYSPYRAQTITDLTILSQDNQITAINGTGQPYIKRIDSTELQGYYISSYVCDGTTLTMTYSTSYGALAYPVGVPVRVQIPDESPSNLPSDPNYIYVLNSDLVVTNSAHISGSDYDYTVSFACNIVIPYRDVTMFPGETARGPKACYIASVGRLEFFDPVPLNYKYPVGSHVSIIKNYAMSESSVYEVLKSEQTYIIVKNFSVHYPLLAYNQFSNRGDGGHLTSVTTLTLANAITYPTNLSLPIKNMLPSSNNGTYKILSSSGNTVVLDQCNIDPTNSTGGTIPSIFYVTLSSSDVSSTYNPKNTEFYIKNLVATGINSTRYNGGPYQSLLISNNIVYLYVSNLATNSSGGIEESPPESLNNTLSLNDISTNSVADYVSGGILYANPGDSGEAIWSTQLLTDLKFCWWSLMPGYDPSTTADFLDAADVGVINVVAAGNYYQYIDAPGGPDYNNYIVAGHKTYYNALDNSTVDFAGIYYYNRAPSPAGAYDATRPNSSPIVVGAYGVGYPGKYNSSQVAWLSRFGIDSASNPLTDTNKAALLVEDYKSEFSNHGPRVDIWAPGALILSSAYLPFVRNGSLMIDPRVANGAGVDKNDPAWTDWQSLCTGTSMACPHVTGVVACILEKYPRMTTSEAKIWLRSVGQSTLVSTTNTNNSGKLNNSSDADILSTANNSVPATNKILYLPNSRVKDSVEGGGFNSSTFPNLNAKYRPISGALYPRKNVLNTEKSNRSSILKGMALTCVSDVNNSILTSASYLDTFLLKLSTGLNGNPKLSAGTQVPYSYTFKKVSQAIAYDDPANQNFYDTTLDYTSRNATRNQQLYGPSDSSGNRFIFPGKSRLTEPFHSSRLTTVGAGQTVPGTTLRVAATEITNNLLGRNNLTKATGVTGAIANTFHYGSIVNQQGDPGYRQRYFDFQCPWDIQFLGSTYNHLVFNEVGYMVFGTNINPIPAMSIFTDLFDPVDLTSWPIGMPALTLRFRTMWYGDLHTARAQSVFGGVEGTAPNRTFRIRVEAMYDTIQTSVNFPNALYNSYGDIQSEYELIFRENSPNQIDIHMGKDAYGMQHVGPEVMSGYTGSVPYTTSNTITHGDFKAPAPFRTYYSGYFTIGSDGNATIPMELVNRFRNIANFRVPIYGGPMTELEINPGVNLNRQHIGQASGTYPGD